MEVAEGGRWGLANGNRGAAEEGDPENDPERGRVIWDGYHCYACKCRRHNRMERAIVNTGHRCANVMMITMEDVPIT